MRSERAGRIVAACAVGWLLRATATLQLCALLLAACSDGRTPLVIYSPHGRDLLTQFERRFEAAHPDVDVRWLDMGSQEVLERLRSERANPQADLWFGGPHTLFMRAARDSLLEATDPSGALFVSVYRTPAVIAYNAAAVPAAEAPRDWDDVLAPRWRGRVLIRDPMASGTMRSIFGMIVGRSIRTTGDTAAGFAWLRRLDGQTKEYVFNPALLTEKLVRQEGTVTLWELADLLTTMHKGRPLGFLFPASGTPVIDDAIAVVRGAGHADLARRFAAWVVSPELQLLAAREQFRLPARTDLPPESLPAWVREVEATLRPEPMDWELLEARGAEWMIYWDRQVRGTGRR
ncbi:MAG: extracellular solute-binding protein [Gemmatimonadetes bacterium]|nr:extracellular solute-binding protein [Gemmatimonadota bacterium]